MERPRGIRRDGAPDRRFWVENDDYAVATTVALRQHERASLTAMGEVFGPGENRSRVMRALIALMVRERAKEAAGDPTAFPMTQTLVDLDRQELEKRP